MSNWGSQHCCILLFHYCYTWGNFRILLFQTFPWHTVLNFLCLLDQHSHFKLIFCTFAVMGFFFFILFVCPFGSMRWLPGQVHSTKTKYSICKAVAQSTHFNQILGFDYKTFAVFLKNTACFCLHNQGLFWNKS